MSENLGITVVPDETDAICPQAESTNRRIRGQARFASGDATSPFMRLERRAHSGSSAPT
jgi:hypothetical protein